MGVLLWFISSFFFENILLHQFDRFKISEKELNIRIICGSAMQNSLAIKYKDSKPQCRFGRRMALLVDCLPLIIGWILTWRAQSLLHLYIAR